VLDRDTRNVDYSAPFTTGENAEGPIGTSFTHVCPGLLGGHEWNGAAYSPRLNALFLPATDWCNQLRPAAQPPDPQGQENRGQFFGAAQIAAGIQGALLVGRLSSDRQVLTVVAEGIRRYLGYAPKGTH